jgi:hypothetical protein
MAVLQRHPLVRILTPQIIKASPHDIETELFRRQDDMIQHLFNKVLAIWCGFRPQAIRGEVADDKVVQPGHMHTVANAVHERPADKHALGLWVNCFDYSWPAPLEIELATPRIVYQHVVTDRERRSRLHAATRFTHVLLMDPLVAIAYLTHRRDEVLGQAFAERGRVEVGHQLGAQSDVEGQARGKPMDDLVRRRA